MNFLYFLQITIIIYVVIFNKNQKSERITDWCSDFMILSRLSIKRCFCRFLW